ncbi:MAG: hypothetical protein K0S11_1759 [Gammaproteobacteria bacterium]|jgi:hypothetical protein|nr:hypothetical protein [Gammaproteobacteria bacterium]
MISQHSPSSPAQPATSINIPNNNPVLHTNPIDIAQLITNRQQYLQQHQPSKLEKLAQCLKLYEPQQLQSTLHLLLSHLIDKKYTYLASGILNAIAATLAKNYSRESNTLLIIATLIGLTNYSVFKTAEVIRVNKKVADEIYGLAKALRQAPQLQRLQGARIYGIIHETVTPIVFSALAGYLIYLNWSDAANKDRATTWVAFSYLLAGTLAHLLANGILTAFRNSALSRKQQLSNQLNLRMGSHFGTELNQQQAKDDIEALLSIMPTLTARCIEQNYPLAETLLILDCCSRLHMSEKSIVNNLETHHLDAIKRNHNIYQLLANRLLSTDTLFKLTQPQLEKIDTFDVNLLNSFQPTNSKAVRRGSRLLWEAYAEAQISLETEAHLKVFSYLFQNYSTCCDIFKTRQTAIEFMGKYITLTEYCIDQDIPAKTISQYLKLIDKLHITADEASELQLIHLNALLSKASNWLWLLDREENILPTSQFARVTNESILRNINLVAREVLETYLQSYREFRAITRRVETMTPDEIGQLNADFKQASSALAKQQVINEWLNSATTLNNQTQPQSVLQLR